MLSTTRCCGSTRDGRQCSFVGKYQYKGDPFCGVHKPGGSDLTEQPPCEGQLKSGQPCGAPVRDLVDSHFYCARHSPREKECPICFTNMTVATTRELQECHHRFHKSCIAKWIGHGKNTCPICRTPIATPSDSFQNAMLLSTLMTLISDPGLTPTPTIPSPSMSFAPWDLGLPPVHTGRLYDDYGVPAWPYGVQGAGNGAPPHLHMLAALSVPLPPP